MAKLKRLRSHSQKAPLDVQEVRRRYRPRSTRYRHCRDSPPLTGNRGEPAFPHIRQLRVCPCPCPWSKQGSNFLLLHSCTITRIHPCVQHEIWWSLSKRGNRRRRCHAQSPHADSPKALSWLQGQMLTDCAPWRNLRPRFE